MEGRKRYEFATRGSSFPLINILGVRILIYQKVSFKNESQVQLMIKQSNDFFAKITFF